MTKIATNTVAKASVAFVTVAMMFTLVAPAKAATTTELEAQIAALLAQIATLQANMSGGTTTSTCDVPAQPLTIGSQGAEVTALQNFLINAGEVIPAGATGYFGSQTQAALASWQAANGVSPAVGYYGPITKSAMESACVVTTPDDGGDDSDMGSDGLGSDEGDIDSVSETAADESTLDEGEFGGVLAFELEIEGDVEVDRIDFFAARTSSTGSNDADDYFDSATLFVDGDEVAEMDVDDFDQDDYDHLGSSDEDDYRLRFSGLGLVFEDGDTPELQLAFQAANSIDTNDQDEDWTAALQSIRFVDGAGFTDTWTGVETANVLTEVTEQFGFSAEEVAQWSITTASDDPDATTFEIDTDDESEEYTVFVFEIEEENGVDSMLEDIRLNATTTGSTTEADVIDEIRLYHNGELLASEAPTSGATGGRDIDFENLDVAIDADETEEFEVRMIFKGTEDHGSASTVKVGIDSVRKASDDNGNDEDDMTISGTPESETHTLRADGVEIAEGDDDSASIKDTTDSAGGEEGVFAIKFEVTAFGDDMYIPVGAVATSALDVNDGIGYQIEDGDGSLVTVGAGTGTTTAAVSTSADLDSTDSYYVVEQGDTETFTLSVTYDPNSDGYYKLQLTGVNFNVGSGANADTTESAVPASDYETDAVNLDA